MSATRSLTIANLQRAVQQASRAGDWVVVVYPTTELVEKARTVLPAMIPEGSTGGGRTTLIPGEGRVSIVTADEPPFQTERGLTLLFLGWDAATEKQYEGMSAWRAVSSKVIGVEEGRAA